jgi:hypothetical protein
MLTIFRWPVLSAALLAVVSAGASAADTPTKTTASPGASAAAAPAKPTAEAQSPEVTASQAKARAILKGMADYLARTPHFSVAIQSGYDVLQASGQKIEFGDTRKVVVSRPDRLNIDIERSDGEKGRIVYDGKQITGFVATQNRYAQAAVPGDLDKAITYAVKDLKMRVPLAMLYISQLPAELDRRVQSVDYVEKTTLSGVPCHHLAARAATVDFQLWIADGDQPLPRRVVLTYKDAPGQPQYWADLSDWDLAPKITDATFAFTPPKDAQKIPFLSELRRSGNLLPAAQAPKEAKP